MHSLAKMPTSMYQFASWLEDWVTKLVVADEASAHIEHRRAMAVLFMTEWVAIFRESGLRDDVTIANLQEACLKMAVLARARARELQVDLQVERAQQPLPPRLQPRRPNPSLGRRPRLTSQSADSFSNQMDARMETNASTHIHESMESVCVVALSHTVFKPAPVLADNSLLGPVVPSKDLRRSTPSLKGRQLTLSRLRHQLLQIKRKGKASLKVRIRSISLLPRVAKSTLTRPPRMIQKNLTIKRKGKMMIQESILQMPRLLRVRWTLASCLIGQQVSARITRKVHLLWLHAHLHQPPQNL